MSRWPSRVARGRRVPLGLLGMIALVVLIERSVARYEARFTPSWALDWRLTGRAARTQAPGCGVLCLGDSLVKLGIVPRAIERRLGKPSYNLALSAGPAPASFVLLRRALAAGAHPEAIVLDFTPHLLADDPRIAWRLWPELVGLRDALDLARSARDADWLTALVLGRTLPSVRARFEIRAALRGDGRGDPLAMFRRNWAFNRGAQVMPRSPEFTGRADVWPGARRVLYPDTCRVHPVNELYVGRLLALAATRRIPVFWLLPPVCPDLQDRRERSGAEAQYIRFVRRMQARSPGVTVVDGRRAGYDHTVHCDPLHLDCRGAYALSVGVAEVIGRGLGAAGSPRWVELPSYQDRTIDIALEDLEQSRQAVRRRAALTGSAGAVP
jgi:hypothetical protein